MQTHHFHAGAHTTWRGERLCEGCGDVEAAKVHRVPEIDEAAKEIDQRKLGEAGPG